MRRMLLVGVLLSTVLLVPAFAQNATVKQVNGMVQLLAPGGAWANAAVGSVVTQGTVVSTGFNSTAVLDLGTSQIQVKPLTRLKLNELLRTRTTATTALFLTVGAVRADVANNLGITQKFKIESPVSTAAVRGTIFEFNGYSVSVDRGIVHFANIEGLGREVAVNQSSEITTAYVPASAEEFQAAATQVSINTNPNISTTTVPTAGATTATVTITISKPQ